MNKKFLLAAAAATTLTGCADMPAWLFNRHDVAVDEVRRLSVCHTAGDQAQLSLLPDAAAVEALQAQRGIDLIGAEPLPPGPFVLAELGRRNTGGYAMVVSHQAVGEGDLLKLYATFFAPSPGQPTAQAQTSPCVLVALPAYSHYSQIRLVDPAGDTRAKWNAERPAPAAGASGPAA